MKLMKKILISVFLLAALLLTSILPGFASSPVGNNPSAGAADEVPPVEDNLPDPLTMKKLELRQEGIEAKLNGKAYGKTHEVARGQYVQLDLEGTGMVWTVMAEFADVKHNIIPQPDRTVDNTTLWVPDFNKAHMDGLLYDRTPGANSMANYYLEQSSGRYTVAGEATDWLTVPGVAADYDYPQKGRAVWNFIKDSVNAWYAAQIAAGKTDAEINAYLKEYDKRDRYDYDGDGNFNEPDGYIDTFQSVHAYLGEEAGAPSWTIWSHSWYAFFNLQGTAGPPFNLYGGCQIGNSDYWVGKYTIQPENGGVGVFTHEFGHDLGLPDLYDTSGGENGTGFWTLMSSGSWMGDGAEDIGSKSSHMGAWEKFQLGWLNYEVAYAGQKSEHKLGPMEFNTKQAQGVFVILPKKGVVSNIGAPYAGTYYYYSSAGDRLDNFMYKQFNLAAGSTLTAKVKYNIELDWDYAYLVYSTDNGATWTGVETNLSTTTNPYGQNYGYGITGNSGGNWVDLTANLPAGDVLLGFRYWTDANTGGFGFMVDDINITGFPTDGAETDAGWTYKPTTGFHVTNGTETKWYNNYYVLEYRTYKGYDSTLRDGPYFFGYTAPKNNFVDHFAYQDGLLINYWDTSQANNQTKNHPGAGLLLPIDAHFAALYRVDGLVWRNRIQTYDSTFTLAPTDGIPNVHVANVLSPVPSLPAVRVFDDRITYYDPANPQGSVMNPNTGTLITIRSISALDSFMQVQVAPAK
jgi:immune inhibitor A